MHREGVWREDGLTRRVLITRVSAAFHGVLPLSGSFTFHRAGTLVLEQQGRLAPGKDTELSPGLSWCHPMCSDSDTGN